VTRRGIAPRATGQAAIRAEADPATRTVGGLIDATVADPRIGPERLAWLERQVLNNATLQRHFDRGRGQLPGTSGERRARGRARGGIDAQILG